MFRRLAIAASLLLPGLAARAETPPSQSHAGEIYEIRSETNSSWTGSTGSTGSTHDVDIVIERVIAEGDAGEELEFDVPNDPSTDASDRDWRFPARVLRPPHGSLQLLNAPELETRLNRWLHAASLTREACAHWIFTWNAFQIVCDPQSVIEALEPFDLWPDDLREGASYQQKGSRTPVTLRQESTGPGRAVFVARMEIDPEAVRHERARQDVAVAEIMHRSVTFEDALRAKAAEQISGTIMTTFEVEAGRNVRRRTTVTELDISGADGPEHRTVTETVERRPVSGRAPAR